MNTVQVLMLMAAGVVFACFATSCNLLEGIHQFNPNYKNPVPFSSNWRERRAEKKER